MNTSFKIATFAGGCFWGMDSLFCTITGVQTIVVGYTGGYLPYPSYEDVCSDTTGHAEAIEIQFDPTVISYTQLLEIFWANHDPTTLNRQGADIGTQYRSAIFYHSEQQKKDAEKIRLQLEIAGIFKNLIVTEIIPAQVFYPAEEYQQHYLAKNGIRCHLPKFF